MMRRLGYSEKFKELFPLIYEGFLAGGLHVSAASRTPEIKRQERTVLRALRSISAPLEECFPNSQEKQRVLRETSTLELGQVELDLLVRYVETAPWIITKVDLGMDAADLLLSSDKV